MGVKRGRITHGNYQMLSGIVILYYCPTARDHDIHTAGGGLERVVANNASPLDVGNLLKMSKRPFVAQFSASPGCSEQNGVTLGFRGGWVC